MDLPLRFIMLIRFVDHLFLSVFLRRSTLVDIVIIDFEVNDTCCVHNNGANFDPTVALCNQHLRKKNLAGEEWVSIVNWLLLKILI